MDQTETQPPLGEMLRILDVARTLREERLTVERERNRDQLAAALRERLLASAEYIGGHVTAAEVDAAIQLYFDRLHVYADPPWSLSLLVAHLWVRRWLVSMLLLIAAVLIWILRR